MSQHTHRSPTVPFDQWQQAQITTFHQFCNEIPDKYCAICMQILYPEDLFYNTNQFTPWPCEAWKLTPFANDNHTAFIVCKKHKNTKPPYTEAIKYPGDTPGIIHQLNYREKSMLSPIKLMTQMTRKSSIYKGRIGHYEIKGSLYMKHSYEFPAVAYGGSIGLTFTKGEPGNVNIENVKNAFQTLQQTNPLLHSYNSRDRLLQVIEYHLQQNGQYIQANQGWKNNIILNSEDVNPIAAELKINNLLMGTDDNDTDIKASHPSLMALLFPYLFVNGKGHYSLVPNSETSILPEERGGIASASKHETLASFAKKLLFAKDRRFATDPAFLFWCFDMIEKHNIHSADRHTARTSGRILTKSQLIDNDGNYKREKVTIVPYTIRSSLAYKRRHYLDLKTMGESLGEPQLFLTFSCDDFASEFKAATNSNEPWTDPVIFALHFKRKWNKFFNTYIMKKWATKIGGIRDWSYTMEIQDRGSPHMHVILWTEKTAHQLLEDNVVCTEIPESSSTMYPLVIRLF